MYRYTLIELRFYVRLDTKQVISKTFTDTHATKHRQTSLMAIFQAT